MSGPGKRATPPDSELTHRFRMIAERVASILGSKVPPTSKDRFVGLHWVDSPLEYDHPRFGVMESPRYAVRAGGFMLQLSEALQQEPDYLLEWVLWREAFLEHLVRRVRLVAEAADLGLYGGLKYGIKSSEHRKRLQQVWEKVSPPQHYEFYSYVPTVGFALFDNVVDDTFLSRVIPLCNTLRGDKTVPMASATFTALLERYMLETHQVLNETEVRLLTAISSTPNASQHEIAQQLKLSRAAVSQSINKLASKYLLRINSYLNLPVIGLNHVVVFLHFQQYQVHYQLRRKLSQLRYAHDMKSFTDSLLLASFTIPQDRVRQFEEWINRLCQKWNLSAPIMRLVSDIVLSRSFSSYIPDYGWASDFSHVINQIHYIVQGTVSNTRPPGRRFTFSYDNSIVPPSQPLRLRPEDFTYFKRATRSLLATEKATSSSAREIREVGLAETAHMRYRRRVGVLERHKVMSPPLGIGLLHIGLNAAIGVIISAPRETTERIMHACQLLPAIYGVLFSDGGGVMFLLVPNPVSIDVYSSLRSLFAESGIDAVLTVRPAWQAFAVLSSPINQDNYDFEKEQWIWTEEQFREFTQ